MPCAQYLQLPAEQSVGYYREILDYNEKRFNEKIAAAVFCACDWKRLAPKRILNPTDWLRLGPSRSLPVRWD
jgi:hypothetical protein